MFAFSCHTVLQKNVFAWEGLLRIFAPIIKKKGGWKRGKRGKVPWETGAGTTCCISVYLFNHYTVLQKNTFAREGRLRISAPIIIKKRGKRGKRGKGPLESGAGTTSSISVYLLNHYTVLQKNIFAREGRLRISAPIIIKKRKKGEKEERSPRDRRRNDFQHLCLFGKSLHRSSKKRIRAKRSFKNFRPDH